MTEEETKANDQLNADLSAMFKQKNPEAATANAQVDADLKQSFSNGETPERAAAREQANAAIAQAFEDAKNPAVLDSNRMLDDDLADRFEKGPSPEQVAANEQLNADLTERFKNGPVVTTEQAAANAQLNADLVNRFKKKNEASAAIDQSPAPTATYDTATAPTATPQTNGGSGEGIIRPKINGAPKSTHGGMPVGNVSGDTLVNVTKDGNLSSGGTTALYFGNDSAEGEAAKRVVQNLLANNGQNLSRVGILPGGAGGFKEGSYSARAVADIQEDAARRKLGRTFVHDKIVTDGLVGILNTFNGESGNPGSEVEQNGKRIVGIEKEACDEINAQLKQTGANYRVVGMSVQKGTDGNPLFKVYTVDKNGKKHCDIRTVKQVYETRKTALADASLGVRVKGETEAARAERRKAALALDGKTGQPSVIESGLINELGDVNFVDGAYRERNAEMLAKVEKDKASAKEIESRSGLEERKVDIAEKEADANIKAIEDKIRIAEKTAGIEEAKNNALIEKIRTEMEIAKRQSDNEATPAERERKMRLEADVKSLSAVTDLLAALAKKEMLEPEDVELKNQLVARYDIISNRIINSDTSVLGQAMADDRKKLLAAKEGEIVQLSDGSLHKKKGNGFVPVNNAK